MHLFRLALDGIYAAGEPSGELRALDLAPGESPFATPPERWKLGGPAPVAERDERALLAPVTPTKIVGIGRNYRAHAQELNNPVPEEPLLFLKAPSSIIGPGETIRLPPESERVDFEGEIALVIGQRVTRATPEEARDAIFGLTCACDVTARDLQRKDKTFARGKSFDTFCPIGPGVALGLDFGDADLADLKLETLVNGELRQRGHVWEMLWGPVDLVTYVSRMMTLEPGDLILTGTPAGVGPLSPGDQVEVRIDGIGSLTNPVAAHPRSP